MQKGHPHQPQTYGIIVLSPKFDGLVSLASDEARARGIKRRRKDAALGVEGARLDLALRLLEVVTSLPIPEVEIPIVRWGGRGVKDVDKCTTYCP